MVLKTGLDHVSVSLVVDLHDAALAIFELDPNDMDAVSLGGRRSNQSNRTQHQLPDKPAYGRACDANLAAAFALRASVQLRSFTSRSIEII